MGSLVLLTTVLLGFLLRDSWGLLQVVMVIGLGFRV